MAGGRRRWRLLVLQFVSELFALLSVFVCFEGKQDYFFPLHIHMSAAVGTSFFFKKKIS